MKRILIGSLLLVFFINAFSQGVVPSRDDINAFFNTKTLVVLPDNPLLEYNLVIKKVMEQEWTITPYEFISLSQFEDMRKDPQYSFLNMTLTTFDNDKTDARYRFLNLSLGGDYFRQNQMPDMAFLPLAYYSVDESRYTYKLALLVRFIQNHVNLIKENPNIVSQNVFNYYNENIKDIKTKTLYILEEELAKEVNSAARIKKVYPYKFKIVTADEIQEAIKNKDENVVFLHKVGPEGTKTNARCYKIIVGAADANFYYFNYHKINAKNPDGFLAKDFKKLASK